MWGKWVLSLVLLALLTACSPRYDWRPVSLAGGAVTSALPDKPVARSRTLDFAGHNVTLTFLLAEVHGALFAVGYAPLPASLQHDEALRTEMGRQVIESFYHGLNVARPQTLPAFGKPFWLQGTSAGASKPTALRAVVWVTPRALVEAMVTADAAAFPDHEAARFLDSTTLR